MDKFGVGFVGAGFVTNTFHIAAWPGIRYADINGICTTSLESGKASADLCRKLGVGNPGVYNDVRELVRDPKVDAIWITVPNFARIPVMQAIIEEVTEGRAKLIGVACEKPLARNVAEAQRMLKLAEEAGILHGYLENQIFAPSVVRGKEVLWGRGASLTGRPYLVRCAEEHSGQHKPWFWDGTRQGGGVLLDMMCHSHEAARFLLTSPDETKEALKPRTVSAEIASLKWTRPDYIERLRDMTKGEIDYSKAPAEDFARANVIYGTPEGLSVMAEVTTSWSFVGPGIRLSFELLGPEYYMDINTLKTELDVFFSREVKGKTGEDMLEKQTCEQGLMPVVSDEAITYGYLDEDRHMVDSFLKGEMPCETFRDGVFVIELLMSSYMAAEKGEKLSFPPRGLEEFVPQVARGTWDPRSIEKASPK